MNKLYKLKKILRFVHKAMNFTYNILNENKKTEATNNYNIGKLKYFRSDFETVSKISWPI